METSNKHGHDKVSQLKLAVVKISAFMAGGGYMFAMCSATDSYDIALAAQNTDICESMFDGDPMDPNAQSQLDFSKTLAFKDFNLRTNPMDMSTLTLMPTSNDKCHRRLITFPCLIFRQNGILFPPC